MKILSVIYRFAMAECKVRKPKQLKTGLSIFTFAVGKEENHIYYIYYIIYIYIYIYIYLRCNRTSLSAQYLKH